MCRVVVTGMGELTLLLLDWQPPPGSKLYHSLQALNQLSSGHVQRG